MKTLEERFWQRVKKGKKKGDCWNWIGYIAPNGYGSMGIKHKTINAHKISYELFVKKVPKGLTLDHLCRNIKCVNPKHLEIVTLKENILRGNSPSAINNRKTHCVHGHPLTSDNIHVKKNGKRICRTCNTNRLRNLRSLLLAKKKDI